MNRKDFINLVRRGKTEVRIDDVEVSFRDEKITGSGTLECKDKKFNINVRLPIGANPPREPLKNFFGRDDLGILSGTIDYDLPFKVAELFPSCSYTNTNGKITLSYDTISFIDLIPERWDTVPTEVKLWINDQLKSGGAEGEFVVEINDPSESDSSATSVSISGLLLGYKLIAKNAGTEIVETNAFLGKRTSSKLDTIHGTLSPEWDFALLERDDNIEFHLRLREGCISKSEADDLKVFSAFQTAMAFIHGQNTWPFTLEHWRDGRMVLDRVHPPHTTKRIPFRPFSERIWANSRQGKIEWSFEDALGKAFLFFYEESELSEEVAQLLFLLREAVGPTKNIVFCSLLESLVKAIFESLITVPEPIVRGKKPIKNGPANITQKFCQVVNNLKLPWEGDWEELCEYWRGHRNRLVHRPTKGGNDDPCDEFQIESRIAGAINMLILKLMGYKGIVNSSVFEDKFKRI